LPYDAEADRKRWDELEKDFDRIFEDAARPRRLILKIALQIELSRL
jgi:hypothetical protein